jgi:hypothetical protein
MEEMPIMIPVLNHVTNSHQLVQDGFSIHSMFVSIFLPPKMGGGGPKSFPFGRDGPTSGPRFDVQPQWQGCAGLHKNGGGRTFFLSSGVNEKSGRKPIEKPAFRNDFFRMLPGEYMFGFAPLSFHFNMFQPHVAVDANILTYRISQKKHKGRYGDAPF